MTQAIVPAIVALLASLVAVAARNTRRARLRGKAEAYAALADSIEKQDPETASELRSLVRDIIGALVKAERASLNKQLQTDNLIGVIAFLTAAGAISWIATSIDSPWARIPLYMLSISMVLLALIGGATQLWKSHEPEAETSSVSEPSA